MPRLTEIERRTLIEDLKRGDVDDNQIRKKYNVTTRQLRYYRESQGISRPSGRPPEGETIIDEEATILNDQPRTLNPDPEIIPEPTPQQPKQQQQLDPNKDYCANCHASGIITEIQKGQYKCQICNTEFNWG